MQCVKRYKDQKPLHSFSIIISFHAFHFGDDVMNIIGGKSIDLKKKKSALVNSLDFFSVFNWDVLEN